MERERSWRDFVGQIGGGGLNVVWTSCIFKTRKVWVLEILPCSYDTNSFDSFPFVSVTWGVMHKLVQNVPCNMWCERQCRCKTLVTATWRTLSFVSFLANLSALWIQAVDSREVHPKSWQIKVTVTIIPKGTDQSSGFREKGVVNNFCFFFLIQLFSLLIPLFSRKSETICFS